MTNCTPAIVAVFLLVAGSLRAEEHPFARAKVGEWAWYTTKQKSKTVAPTPLPPNIPASIRRQMEEQTKRKEAAEKEPAEVRLQVTAKTDTRVVVTNMGRDRDRDDYESALTVDLTRPYQPFLEKSAPVRELGRGTEVLTVNGERYETAWIEYEIEFEILISMVAIRAKEKKKIWRSANVPIDGMVRLERTYSSDAVTLVDVTELTAFGRDRPSGISGGAPGPNSKKEN